MPSRVHLGLVLDEVALGQFSLQVLLFCWQYHSMAALYSLMHHLLDGRWGLLAAVIPRSLAPAQQ
jgi:hypothetical protein